MEPIEVAAGIILRGQYVLIARRQAGAHLGGLWEFPGGRREAGETLEECLAREIREELRLTVRVGRHVMTVEQPYPDNGSHVTLHFFQCVPVSGTPEAVGCAEYRWVPLEELSLYEFPPADQPLLKHLKLVPPV